MAAALWLDRPPTVADRGLVTMLAYVFLLAVALPVLLGGKIYNMLQAIMTVKVAVGARLLFDGRLILRQRGQLVERLQRVRQVRDRAHDGPWA